MYFSKLILIFANSVDKTFYVQHLVVEQFFKDALQQYWFSVFSLTSCLPHLVFIVFCETSGSVLMSKHEFLEWQLQDKLFPVLSPSSRLYLVWAVTEGLARNSVYRRNERLGLAKLWWHDQPPYKFSECVLIGFGYTIAE